MSDTTSPQDRIRALIDQGGVPEPESHRGVWWAFTAYNAQTLYGYGVRAEADEYCDVLNRDREINVYGAVCIGDDSAIDTFLVEGDGVVLEDALTEEQG